MSSEFHWSTAISVFFAYVLLDALYAVYTDAIGSHKAGRAAWLAMGIYGISAFGVKTYISNVWYCIPLAAGAWTGTYFTIAFLRYQSLKKSSEMANRAAAAAEVATKDE